MLLSLPVELVERILRLALPDEITSSTYTDRQSTLRSLCLVSSALRRLAQPILEQAVYLKSIEAFKVYEKVTVSQNERVRFFWSSVAGLPYPCLAAILERCVNLRDFRLANMQKFDYRYLHNTTEITLCHCAAVPSGPIMPLSPSSFPALRRAALFHSDAAFDSHLLGQLEVVLTSKYGRKTLGLGSTSACQILHDIGSEDLDEDDFPATSKSCPACRIFESDDGTVAASDMRLRLLYLPSSFSPDHFTKPKHRERVEGFLAVCTARGIEVDFEDTDEAAGAPLVSPKFVEYARRQVVVKRA
ncbi:hypothetical protein JCM8097_004362 [Rhodosporidiobolus ruineniae]